jgi:hypothetical protein
MQQLELPRWSSIIPKMNNSSISHKLCATTTMNSHQIQKISKPTVVTICLTDGHEECTGTYVDTTCSFKIQCKCACHVNGSIKSDFDKKMAEKSRRNDVKSLKGDGV